MHEINVSLEKVVLDEIEDGIFWAFVALDIIRNPSWRRRSTK